MFINAVIWVLNPLHSQLGHAYICRIFCPLILMWHSACSGQKSFSSNGLADFGGKHGSPAKQNLTTSLSVAINPLVNSLSDDRKSDRIKFLNILYIGLLFYKSPY
jgi:hypothetical protein